MSRVTVRSPVRRYRDGAFVSAPDALAGEEPLEIRLDGRSLSTTMRTPGHDIELVHGLLHAEGVIDDRADIAAIRYCDGVDEQGRNTYNVLDVTSTDPVHTAARAASSGRNLLTSSACGVCGTATIEALHRRSRYDLRADRVRFDPAVVAELPELLRHKQSAFRSTGGVHAAAIADPSGALRWVREDVGRHNAVDKVVGAALMEAALPVGGRALVVSSRASFELVQKAALAGIPMLVAVSAPTSLAVEVARATGLTLVAFTRGGGFNLYSGDERIDGT